MEDVRAGSLLVATPALVDPNFARTVVFLLDADDDGALGVVLNRPTGLEVRRVLEPWADLGAGPGVLFAGGPVEPDGALAVGLRRGDAETVGLRPVLGRLALVDLDAPVDLIAAELAELRIFAGYAGWGRDQLRGEIEEGSWYVVPGTTADLFRADVADLWRDVLRRQPGDLALHSTRPLDPGRN